MTKRIPDPNKFIAGNKAHIKNIASAYSPETGNIELRYSIIGMNIYIIKPKIANATINWKEGMKSMIPPLIFVSATHII
ncbi:unnamed protein product [marine sediment metagenome]|uniref:Uncharacterized protein n=1 Tax=marine sediment metagenome TaxID=412755 RepID=X0VRX6_9ZZZZ